LEFCRLQSIQALVAKYMGLFGMFFPFVPDFEYSCVIIAGVCVCVISKGLYVTPESGTFLSHEGGRTLTEAGR
jgi:hypothetical protein